MIDSRLFTFALAGMVFGLGLGLWSNASGVVLAFYGLVVAAFAGLVATALKPRR